MTVKNPKVDAYISKSPAFARPVMTHIRKLVHQACPDVVEEMKWSRPAFEYHGLLCGFAAFKAHCSVGFWKGDLVYQAAGLTTGQEKCGMGHFGKITSLADLPADKVILELIRTAMRLNETGVKVERPKPVRTELVMPDCLTAALRKNSKAKTVFENFSYSKKKEYVEWITEAKTDATRDRRLATALEWIAEGKSRNWKYENC
jgi:uncharacterized protein YdeI (YjbR/CyaY-like superfamily)